MFDFERPDFSESAQERILRIRQALERARNRNISRISFQLNARMFASSTTSTMNSTQDSVMFII